MQTYCITTIAAIAAVPRDPRVPRLEVKKRPAEEICFGKDLRADDVHMLTGTRLKVRALVAADQAMSKFRQRVSRFPKAAPAAAFA